MSGPMSPAGWYPDPSGAPQLRYFDGRSWTEHVSAMGAPRSGGEVPPLGDQTPIPHGSQGDPSSYAPQPVPSAGLAPTKRRKWPWIALVLAVVIVAVVVISVAVAGGFSTSSDQQNKTVTVTYEATGLGDETFINYGSTEIVWAYRQRLPWSKSVDVTGHHVPVSMGAIVGWPRNGTVTCAIKVGAKVIATQTADGPVANVKCNGTVND